MESKKWQVWSEFVPWNTLRDSGVVEALLSSDAQLLLAVQPPFGYELIELLCHLSEKGVSYGLWPMVEDSQGRWLNSDNAGYFFEEMNALAALHTYHGLPPTSMVIDLEPPLQSLRALSHARASSWWWKPHRSGLDAALASFRRALQGQGWSVEAAALPLAALPSQSAIWGWSRILGTSLELEGFDRVHLMLYPSMLQGYLGRFCDDRLRMAAVDSFVRLALARWGNKVSFALGLSGRGALGTEPAYQTVEDFVLDLSVATCAGAHSFSLHELGGTLSRGGLLAWLRPNETVPLPSPIDPSWKVETTIALLTKIGECWQNLHK